MFIKSGELSEITSSNVHTAASVMAELNDTEVNDHFKKFAAQLKRIAPKAEDFLYFSCVMMTSAEASALNADGTSKLTKEGSPVEVSWDVSPNGSWKWVTNDPSIKAYKNHNGDIFAEAELLKAYKKWVGKPLCVDHKSDQVDAIRGIILDTYYDRLNKRVIALCALDKVSYPELARGVASGYKTSVSMGTRVGRAICYDCGQVATAEREFCQHMRNKSCYGEINVDLDPIELSIVVNGADPQAKIRTILAAANTLRNSIAAKEQEISKLSLNQASMSKFQDLEDDLKKISDKLADLKANLEQEDQNNTSDAAYGQTGNLAVSETDLPNTNQSLSFPERFASNNNALRSELQDLKNSVNSKFQDMEKSLTTLSHKIKEEIMSVNSKDGINKEGYFQGAGGVNEPAPHQVKYPKEPLNEQLREHGDKHMVGVDNMGPVDGMFPGDKEKKTLVQRAELEERAMRRAAALQKAKENLMKSKEAYFQGGGEGNEPTPGKKQYPIDPLDGKTRNKEDKQMNGKKPFPGVGDVDGLYPEDLKKKELLNRASLKARFIRVAGEDGSQDLAQSGWEVKRDEEVLFTATVDEISGGNVDGLYEVIASKEFATKMLEKVYKIGASKAATLYKGAQAVSGMGSQPGAPAEAGGAAPVPPMADLGGMPDMGAAPEADAKPEDNGSEGDPKEVALKLAEEMRDRASDLLEAVRVLTGEQAEMGELEGLSEKAASREIKPLVKMKKTLNAQLIAGMKKAIAELNEHQEELNLIADILNEGTVSNDYTNTVVEEALSDGHSVIADVHNLMGAFVKYARGSEQLSKQAQMLEEKADEGKVEDFSFGDDLSMAEDVKDEEEVNAAADCDEDESKEDEDMNQVMMDVDPTSLQGKKVEIKAASLDVSTKEARTLLRAKLAGEFSPMLDEANKLADGQTELDVKPSGDLGKVETLEEAHKKMLDVAEAGPKVRKEAARLNELILAKKVAKSDLDGLVAKGLDAEVVKYWKQFYGEAGKEGAEFASELLKTHAQEQIKAEVDAFKVKIARAYELTNEMVRRSLVADDRAAITAHVEDMMNWNDDGFEAMKRVVNKHPLRKSASFLPQVGLIGSGDTVSQVKSEATLQDALDQAFGNRRY
jgi:hypothetical protein